MARYPYSLSLLFYIPFKLSDLSGRHPAEFLHYIIEQAGHRAMPPGR